MSSDRKSCERRDNSRGKVDCSSKQEASMLSATLQEGLEEYQIGAARVLGPGLQMSAFPDLTRQLPGETLRCRSVVMQLVRSLTATAFTLATLWTWACGGAATASSPAQPAPPQGGPTLTSLSPSSGAPGTVVTVKGTHFSASGNQVHFGIGYIAKLPSSDGTTLQFVIPETLSPCQPDSPDPCALVLVKVTAGVYRVSVISDGATSSSASFTVK
jgi:hypothetical protein